MANFVHKYLNASVPERGNLINSWLHGIKRENEVECWAYFGDFDFALLTDDNKTDLVQLAVMIEYAFGKRFGRFPRWCLDDRLVLKEPHLGRGYNLSWFFFAPQAFYRHNCFLTPAAWKFCRVQKATCRGCTRLI